MAVADAPGLVLSPTAQVGDGVTFGAHVVVHDGVVIGDGARFGDGAVVGKAPTLHAGSFTAAPNPDPLVIGAGAIVGANAVVFAGAWLRGGASIGDHALFG